MATIQLRDVRDDDLPIFYQQQLDPEANYMAAFTAKDPGDKEAFAAHWAKLRASDEIIKRTVLFEGQVAGSVLSFLQSGVREVTYWIGREYWGRGIATAALAKLLEIDSTRPIYARVAKDNRGSLRVLEKCGFEVSGEDKGYANARGEEIEEFILTLD